MRRSSPKRFILAGMALLALLAAVISALGGLGDTALDSEILWKIRVPRVCLAFIAGSTLALSGTVFQAMFRNPLATPFTLGVSSGASLGAALYVWLGLTVSFLGIPGLSLAAFLGAVLAISIVYGLTRASKGFSTATMLLAGVAVSFFFSSLILFIQYMSDIINAFRIIRWLMGGLEIVGYDPVISLIPFAVGGALIILFLTDELNLLTVGEDIASSRGVNVKRTKSLLFFATSLMVGGVVAVCGPICFVGMIVPHICRLILGAEHRHLAPASLLFGGMFLVLCDALARTLIAPAEIPVGVITALLGGPFFLWLLLRGVSDRGILSSR